ncbi:MAG: hypothetical protein J5804_00275 [Eggerthellaceae bacterium]|nr:hypothetical protein [Eggerthellaceae bacterium]
MVVQARKQASRGKGEWAPDPVRAADVPLAEFSRTEKDADVLAYAFSQMQSMKLLLSIAHDEDEDAFLRAAAIRAYAKRLQSFAQMDLERGDNESAQQVLDALSKECASILGTCSNEEVRVAALEGMAEPEPENLQVLLAEPVDAGKLFGHLLGERDPERIQAIVETLKSKKAPKDFSYAKGPFTILMKNRDSYPDYLVKGCVDVYAR